MELDDATMAQIMRNATANTLNGAVHNYAEYMNTDDRENLRNAIVEGFASVISMMNAYGVEEAVCVATPFRELMGILDGVVVPESSLRVVEQVEEVLPEGILAFRPRNK